MQDVDRKSQVAREVESLLTKKLTTFVFLLDETSDGITFNMVAVVADAIEILVELDVLRARPMGDFSWVFWLVWMKEKMTWQRRERGVEFIC
nr:Kinesin-like calmodulin-binding protein [Ipomoea batatas]GMD88349.1 Kinesin-like calmodulin-binding protein [Ipomoea batatas]